MFSEKIIRKGLPSTSHILEPANSETLREHSENSKGTFREQAGNIQGSNDKKRPTLNITPLRTCTFTDHIGDIQDTYMYFKCNMNVA
jgi:hypothetical protein